MPSAKVDVIGARSGGAFASGGVAQRLLANGFDASALRTNDVLRKEEWIKFDTSVVEIARQRLIGVQDLLGRGLRFDIPNAMGTTRLEWERMSDMDPAEVNMSGIAEGQRDRVTFDLQALPLPIVHKDFSFNIRALEASRTLGQPLDMVQAQLAARLVAEKNEDILFNGSTLVAGGGLTIQGYTTATNRNIGSLSADWALVATTGEAIVRDVIAMIGAAAADRMFGPYLLYVPIAFFNKLADDYKANSDRTIIERVKAIPGIIDIRPTENLAEGASGEVLLIQMSSDVVDEVVGQEPITVQWDEMAGFIINFKVLSIMVPRVRNDLLLQSGIVHYSV